LLPDINRSNLLALIGIFVGLPGFLVFAFSGALGLVIAALVVAMIVGLVVAYQYLDQPPSTSTLRQRDNPGTDKHLLLEASVNKETRLADKSRSGHNTKRVNL
jgi:hypothetical protein